ncbi:YwqJ-related putative deaminase [Kitasatospora sp. HPMI-4]|uniref:YwqJ-related putative deaminase n=1 Tax=Kitasatospora sp. HPMI-4 TaxID=3448443 RepID=UPI003F1DF145
MGKRGGALNKAMQEVQKKAVEAVEKGGKAIHNHYSETSTGLKKVGEDTHKTDLHHHDEFNKLAKGDGEGDWQPVTNKKGQAKSNAGGNGSGAKDEDDWQPVTNKKGKNKANAGGNGSGGKDGGDWHPGKGGDEGESKRPAGGGGNGPGGSGNSRPVRPVSDWHGKTARGKLRDQGSIRNVGDLSAEERLATLKQESADLADKVRDNDRMVRKPGCAGSFDHNGDVTSHTSIRNVAENARLPYEHPTMTTALAEVKASGARIGAGHGRCAEVGLISDRLHRLQQDGVDVSTVAKAKQQLQGGKMYTVQIGDMQDLEGNITSSHGSYKRPCPTCGPLLRKFGIHAQR